MTFAKQVEDKGWYVCERERGGEREIQAIVAAKTREQLKSSPGQPAWFPACPGAGHALGFTHVLRCTVYTE